MAESVTITDNRTGESIEIPILLGGVDARDWAKLLPGIWFYDPAFSTTAAATSAVTELDGDAGILRYRGYPIEQLAEHSTYLEVAYLLIHGELPTADEFEAWRHEITYHTFIHENVRKRFMEGFHHDAHPMGMFVSTLASLSTFYPEAKDIFDEETRYKQVIRLIAKVPTIAAGTYRHSVGMPFVYPNNDLDFCSNFLSMMWRVAEPSYEANPVLARALDVLFILHADHEQNCGPPPCGWPAVALRSLHLHPRPPPPCTGLATVAPTSRSSACSPRSARSTTSTAYIAQVKEGKVQLQGFGHRVYKNFDPGPRSSSRPPTTSSRSPARTRCWTSPSSSKRSRSRDDYFISRKLYPNVDFYSGLIYQSMGFPIDMFTVLFAIPRTAGWLAHWLELLDQDAASLGPASCTTGPPSRLYTPMTER